LFGTEADDLRADARTDRDRGRLHEQPHRRQRRLPVEPDHQGGHRDTVPCAQRGRLVMSKLNRYGTRLDHFSRRRFLGGTGAALVMGLPVLETLESRKAKAADPVPVPRLLCIASGSGVPMEEFTPDGAGPTYTFKQGAGSWGSDTI